MLSKISQNCPWSSSFSENVTGSLSCHLTRLAMLPSNLSGLIYLHQQSRMHADDNTNGIISLANLDRYPTQMLTRYMPRFYWFPRLAKIDQLHTDVCQSKQAKRKISLRLNGWRWVPTLSWNQDLFPYFLLDSLYLVYRYSVDFDGVKSYLCIHWTIIRSDLLIW